MLRSVNNIPGAPPGAYWDGGITDYHLHLNYATDLIAAYASGDWATSQNDAEDRPLAVPGAGLVLYPHFQKSVVPGWLDKGLSQQLADDLAQWRERPDVGQVSPI